MAISDAHFLLMLADKTIKQLSHSQMNSRISDILFANSELIKLVSPTVAQLSKEMRKTS